MRIATTLLALIAVGAFTGCAGPERKFGRGLNNLTEFARGGELRRQRRTDQYGPPFTQTFFRLGRPILELIGPAAPAGTEPARFYGVAFTVEDLDATTALLGDRLGGVKDAVQPGRRIATLRREAGAGIPLAFMSPGADSLARTERDEAQ